MTRRSGSCLRVAALAAGFLVGTLGGPGDAHAQSKTGTTVGTFLMIEPDARISGMGNAGVALDFGLDAVYYNPAAAGSLKQTALAFSHSEWIAGINYNHVTTAVPLGSAGVLLGSVTALTSGDIDVRTVDFPLGTGERYNVTDFALKLGYARAITDRFSVGGRVAYVQERIWNSSTSMGVLDLGTLYRLTDQGMQLGASFSNVGTGSQYDGTDLRITYDQDPDINGDNGTLPAILFTDHFGVPVLFRMGVSMPVKLNARNLLRFAVDGFHPSDNDESISLGSEYTYKDMFALRAGWQNLFLKDAEVGLTLGAGVRGEMNNSFGYHFDYAYADHGRLDQTHRITVGVDF